MMKKMKLWMVVFGLMFMISCGSAKDGPEVAQSPEPPQVTMRDITAQELISEIKVGWNLGNTFDAKGGETAWGNPYTTKEMIDAVAEKGFNCIRIPVSWYQASGDAPEYLLEEEWMNRVEEVVNYALDNEMYVIINTHHEESWLKPDKEHAETSKTILAAYWKQIAERFRDYDEHLLFEGMNEPRIIGSEHEWDGGDSDGRQIIDELNQIFVDTVRATGGNNEIRCLLITSYAAANAENAIRRLAIPEDEHIGVSIHAYQPYLFTYNAEGGYPDWTPHNQRGALESLFMRLDKYFISKGIPVIITEFGAERKRMEQEDGKKGYNDAEVEEWVRAYITEAREAGIPCIWWDNGQTAGGNEIFGVFNREKCTWVRENVVDALIEESRKE